METEHYYHMFANGDDAKNFITNEAEFVAAFNRFAVCAFVTGVKVLSFSVEDSHPHSLLYGTLERCTLFMNLYQDSSVRSIAHRRGSLDGVFLHLELLEIKDEQHLMRTGCYVIAQATKDGKAVMPYDYLYGTGTLYFRSPTAVMPWLVDSDGVVHSPCRFGDLTWREQQVICPSRTFVPDDWLVCNGFILPSNYVDVNAFENIYKTHNCFRAYLGGSKAKDEQLLAKMSAKRGVMVEDLEARTLCEQTCMTMFGKRTTRFLSAKDRLKVAQELRSRYHLALRQLSFLTHIPERELTKYIK